MVDSVVGLKMLIDDHKDTSKMNGRGGNDCSESESGRWMWRQNRRWRVEGGGTETTNYPTTPEKGMSEDDDSTRLDVKRGEVLDPTLMKNCFVYSGNIYCQG